MTNYKTSECCDAPVEIIETINKDQQQKQLRIVCYMCEKDLPSVDFYYKMVHNHQNILLYYLAELNRYPQTKYRTDKLINLHINSINEIANDLWFDVVRDPQLAIEEDYVKAELRKTEKFIKERTFNATRQFLVGQQLYRLKETVKTHKTDYKLRDFEYLLWLLQLRCDKKIRGSKLKRIEKLKQWIKDAEKSAIENQKYHDSMES